MEYLFITKSSFLYVLFQISRTKFKGSVFNIHTKAPTDIWNLSYLELKSRVAKIRCFFVLLIRNEILEGKLKTMMNFSNMLLIVETLFTFVDVPSQPRDLTMTSCTPSTLGVQWNAPETDGGAPITGYTLSVQGPRDIDFKLIKVKSDRLPQMYQAFF